ncbi:MAG: RNA methyltransferase, partial [Thermoplasmata archaeon]
GGRDILLNAKKFGSMEEAVKNFNVIAGTSSTVTDNLKHFRRIPVTPEEFWEKTAGSGAKIALVFGREDDGLRNEELNLCNYFINIPGNPEYPVYNLSHAAAIILYTMFTHFNHIDIKRQQLIVPEHLSILIDEIGKTLDFISYPPHKKENTMVMLNRILGRSMITETEYFKLMGIIRRVRNPGHQYHEDSEKDDAVR